MSDELGADAIRDRVLAAWRAAPDRFREDANAEEDLALGGYRDRAVVELAQNAADAAARAGVPGRLLLRLADTDDGLVLVAANTGAPLDDVGVRSLASLRASAKRDHDSVGRFGVGFAAVLALSDAPVVVSHGRGVRFSRADSAALVADAARDVPALASELERRDGHVPALRLPLPAEGVAPTGYDTAVLLPLHDPGLDGGAAHELARRLLAEVADPLLLALPGLEEVVVEVPGEPTRTLRDVGSRWHVRRAAGAHTDADLADRPTEERRRPAWSVTWAVPRREGADVPGVVHAPTPTDEPLAWPALLIASFPLDPSRRHVAQGPARAAVVAAAAATYAELLAALAADAVDVVGLVPTGLPAGSLDADLREAALPLLARAAVLTGVSGVVVRPRDAVALDTSGDDDRVLAALEPLIGGLVPAPRSATAALAALGVRRVSVAEVVEALPSNPDPAWWDRVYTGLAPWADDAAGREALAALPVPLADGRVVRGVRGLLLPGPDLVADPASGGGPLAMLAEHGLRVVHPDAVADRGAAALLERLGATVADARSVLAEPAVRHAVEAASDAADSDDADGSEDDVSDVAGAVLALVSAAVRTGALRPGELTWLGDLPLPDADGELVPAAGLVLPGSAAERLLDPDEVGVLADGVADRWPAEVLETVGVARTLALLRWSSVETDSLPDDLLDLDGALQWAAGLPAGTAGEVLAVRDLDLVVERRWAEAVAVVTGDPQLLAAVRDPVLVAGGTGDVTRAAPYTAWWLRSRLALGACADPDADRDLAAALGPAPDWVRDLAPVTRAALGLPRRWSDLDAAGWTSVLASPRPTDVAALLAMWRALASAVEAGELADLAAPARLVAIGAEGVDVVAADAAVVVDAPMWWQRTDLGARVVVPPSLADALADVLDLDLASEAAPGDVEPGGSGADVPAAVTGLLPGAPPGWLSHDRLRVDGVEVGWWVVGSGPEADVHATTPSGLARGLAQAAGRWSRRAAVEALLASPESAARVLSETALEDPEVSGG
ncbi:MAG TPA: hypothetical protein VFD41_10275 [Actinomycetales bacterium]|nr:hypothetical protein [Actinomycetales bacterium]